MKFSGGHTRCALRFLSPDSSLGFTVQRAFNECLRAQAKAGRLHRSGSHSKSERWRNEAERIARLTLHAQE